MKTKICLVIICFLISCQLRASDIDDNHEPPVISNIKYEYKIVDSDIYGKDCEGKISFQLGPQKGANGYLVAYDYFRHRWTHTHGAMFKRRMFEVEDGQTINFSSDEFYWDINFKVVVYYDDDSRVSSQIFNTNDFISDDDLNTLKMSSSPDYVNDISQPGFIFSGDTLLTTGCASLNMSIYDLLGQCLFDGIVDRNSHIDISHSASNVIIVKYFDNSGQYFVKKLLKP